MYCNVHVLSFFSFSLSLSESISTVYSTSSAVGGVVGGANDSLPYAGVCVSPCGSLLIAVVSSSILIWDTSNGMCIIYSH